MMIFTDEFLASFDASTTDVATACTLPPEIYTDEAFLAFERRALFSREWLCVGLASQIPEPGDYVTTTANGEPIIVARGKDAAVRAFSAVCRHRGMQIADDAGNCRTFTCPYHQWVYGLDGRLLGAPAMERTVGFDKQQIVLPTLAVEEWQGFVFVNFDPTRPRSAPTLLRYEPYLEHYELDRAVCPGTFTLTDLPWNWKVMFENFNDGYHANRLHHTIQDFCPESPRRVPGAMGRRLQRDLPHQRLHPHRRRLQRHDQGAAAGVPAAHRGGALAQHVRARCRRRSASAPRPTRRSSSSSDPKTVATIDVEIGYLLAPDARSSTRCSSTCSR